MSSIREQYRRARDPKVVDIDDRRPAALRAWASACWALADAGIRPLPPVHIERALKRRGWWPRRAT